MKCSECGGKTEVTDSREVDGYIIRRRVCTKCGRRFKTEEYELVDAKNIKQVRKGFRLQEGI